MSVLAILIFWFNGFMTTITLLMLKEFLCTSEWKRRCWNPFLICLRTAIFNDVEDVSLPVPVIRIPENRVPPASTTVAPNSAELNPSASTTIAPHSVELTQSASTSVISNLTEVNPSTSMTGSSSAEMNPSASEPGTSNSTKPMPPVTKLIDMNSAELTLSFPKTSNDPDLMYQLSLIDVLDTSNLIRDVVSIQIDQDTNRPEFNQSVSSLQYDNHHETAHRDLDANQLVRSAIEANQHGPNQTVFIPPEHQLSQTRSLQIPSSQTSSLQTQLPRTPSPQIQLPRTPSPQIQSPRTPSPQIQSPRTPSPKIQSPRTPSPQIKLPRIPSPQIQLPRTSSLQTQPLQTHSSQTQSSQSSHSELSRTESSLSKLSHPEPSHSKSSLSELRPSKPSHPKSSLSELRPPKPSHSKSSLSELRPSKSSHVTSPKHYTRSHFKSIQPSLPGSSLPGSSLSGSSLPESSLPGSSRSGRYRIKPKIDSSKKIEVRTRRNDDDNDNVEENA